ncbi:MAG: electron transport complex subunit RsxC [Thalassolituus sp.]
MTHLIQLFDFDGGIHPAENKTQSNQRPVRKAPMPEELVLPLQQHIGAPADIIVTVGDTVLKGQVIAEPHGYVSAPLHAPTSGTVTAIEDRQVPHASGLSEICIVIRPDGNDTWIEHQSLCAELGVDDCDDITNDDLIKRIRDCGIAGLGGAGFPTAVKLNTGKHTIDTLILNGAECEPYITADDMLMRERAADVIRGAQILLQIIKAERCLIGVEDNKPEAIKALEDALLLHHEEHHIDVVTIPTKYPSGGEKQLIQILTGREVPSGGIPAQVGIVCQNVGTAAAVADAVDHGVPLISRITTVTGDAVTDKGNWEVLFGTPVSHLLEISGYKPEKKERVIMGGPMMGFALPSLDLPVVKTTNCLLAPTSKELPGNNPAMACIRCGMCATACPAGLLPQQLYWFSRAEELDKAEQHNLFDCIECGACSYVCPSEIPLVQYYRHTKGAIREERAAQEKAEQARQRFEARIARQEREQAEKDAKRKARAEAAAKTQNAKKDAPAKAAPAAKAEQTAAAASNPELEKLQKQLDGAQAAKVKTQEKLEAAKQDPEQADKVAVFEAALVKTQDKIKALAKDIAAAKKAAKAAEAAGTSGASDADKGDPNSPERLKKKWEMAQGRLDTALKRLAQAEEEGSDTVEALKEGIAKQQARVDEAKAAYEKAESGDAEGAVQTEPAAPVAADLTPKIQAQKDRVEKARERLEMAKSEGLETVPALEKAVNKQLEKLAALEAQASSGEA